MKQLEVLSAVPDTLINLLDDLVLQNMGKSFSCLV
jgi:hypothetical protein